MQEQFKAVTQSPVTDKVEVSLRTIAQNVVIVLFGLLPIIFIPTLFAPLGYTKTLTVVTAVFVGCIFFSLSVLRSGSIKISGPWALLAFWAVVFTTAVSALLSGDMYDAFIGEVMGVQTALFILLMGVTMSIPLLFEQNKASVMRLYVLLTGSAVVLGIYHLLRVLFGADFLSFGVFMAQTSSPLGGWNDLGLFLGLSILLSLVALEQLPLTRLGKILFSGVISVALVMLAVINFSAIWVVLGLVSLVQLMYALTKDRFAEQTLSLEGKSETSIHSIVLSIMVFVFSLMFFIGGSTVGGFVSDVTGISYVEVRPSLEATVDIARNVYKENAFVGIGPNKFIDAWRLYKDTSINETIFWSTDFNTGNGFITTSFVTGGIFTVFAWFSFFGLLIMAGFRMLFRSTHADAFWYFIGSSSFVAAIYLWGMSFVYNPGAVILLLAALFTGIVFLSHGVLLSGSQRRFSISANRRAGFILVGVVMMVIVLSASALYYTGRHYGSAYSFSAAVSGPVDGMTLEEVEQSIASAYAANPNDVYARQLAVYQLSKLNALISLQDATPEQQKIFQDASANGINAAKLAVSSDETNPLNWATLGSIYSVLAATGLEGAKDRAVEAFANAQKFDPTNPSYLLLEAQLYSRVGDFEAARAKAIEAVQLKQNYTDALYFLTQLDIAEGNVDDAIITTRAIISLEPNNPARYYQLGVLESSASNIENAIAAFSRAVVLDTNYANARYFLALAHIQNREVAAAIEQLEAVSVLNPDNEGVLNLLEQLRSGEAVEIDSQSVPDQVDEPETVTQGDDVTSSQTPDTPLVSSVNTPVESDEPAGETTEGEVGSDEFVE